MTTQHDTTTHRELLTRLAGQSYSACRAEIEALDWDGWYPVVNLAGDLTGEIAEASSESHDIVDVDAGGVVARPGAADAMLDVQTMLPELADAMGYDRIEFDVENDCYTGYGSADPYDRSKDTPAGYYVCAADEIVATIRWFVRESNNA